MKKEYIAPMLNVVNIRMRRQLMAGSNFNMSGNQASTTEGGDYNTLSRRHKSCWDEEEEDY